MSVRVTVPPTQEPLLVEDVATWLRLETDALEDQQVTVLQELIHEAGQYAEVAGGRALLTQTVQATLLIDDNWLPCLADMDRVSAWLGHEYRAQAAYRLLLPLGPVQSVTTVEIEATPNVWVTTTNYTVDVGDTPGSLTFTTNPSVLVGGPTLTGRVRVTYIAGYGTTPSSVPAPIRRALLQYVAHLYEDRTGTQPIPGTITRAFTTDWLR